MLGLLGALNLTTNKSEYVIDQDYMEYRITGGIPNGAIAWTSFKNGEPTGEYQAWYGQSLDGLGEAFFSLDPWPRGYEGSWQKQVLIIDPNDPANTQVDQVSFKVIPMITAPPRPTTPVPDPLSTPSRDTVLPPVDTPVDVPNTSGGPLGPMIPPPAPVYTTPPAQEPVAPASGIAGTLGGSVNLFGFQVPIILLVGVGALLVFGRR